MFEVYGAVTVNDWMYQNMFAKFYAGICWIILHNLVEFNNGYIKILLENKQYYLMHTHTYKNI